MNIYLKKKHIELLNKYCNLDIPLIATAEGNVLVVGDKAYFEVVLDVISDLLTDKGLNIDSEPNELGLQIEEIIDVVSKVVYG